MQDKEMMVGIFNKLGDDNKPGWRNLLLEQSRGLMKDLTKIVWRDAGFCFLSLLLFASLARGQESAAGAKPSTPKNAKMASKESKPFHEDWSTLTLDHSSLHMQPPVLADTGEIPNTGFIRERYMVTWRPGDPFDLYVIRPKGVVKPPVVLYLYTFPDDTELFKTNHWCEAAVGGGYAAVGFVSALTGHRLRNRLPKESFVTEMQEALAETTHDVQLILDYLGTRTDLDSSRVGMFGVGSGASIAILASAADARIRAVDLLGPWGDWPGWLAHAKIIQEDLRGNFLKPEFLAKVAPLDPVVWLPKMKAKSVRIQDIRKNLSMPDESQEKLEAAAPDFALVNQYGNGRAYLTLQPPAFAFQWVKDQLKPDAKPADAGEKTERIHFFPAIDEQPARGQQAPAVAKQSDGDKNSNKDRN